MLKKFIKITLVATALTVLTLMGLDAWSFWGFIAYLVVYTGVIMLAEWAFEKDV